MTKSVLRMTVSKAQGSMGACKWPGCDNRATTYRDNIPYCEEHALTIDREIEHLQERLREQQAERKIKYEKPVIVDLGKDARAQGQRELKPEEYDCFSGAAPGNESTCIQGGAVIVPLCNCYMGASDA